MKVSGLNLTVRPWCEADRGILLLMVLDCLAINYEAGADMQPSTRNATALVELGLLAAQQGDPCLVALVDATEPVGYTEWVELPNPLGLDFRGRVLHGLGTYVREVYRSHRVSHFLRNEAEAMAARSGFTKVVGTAYHTAGLQSVLARGYRVAGTQVEKGLA